MTPVPERAVHALEEQKMPVQPNVPGSEEIAAAALRRLAAEGHLSAEEAELLRQHMTDAPTEGSLPDADLSPMLTPEERERGHQTTKAAQVIGRIMLLFCALITALIGSRVAVLDGGSLGCFGLLLKVVALLASAVILGWTVLPLAAGMLLGLLLARLARRRLQRTPPETEAYKRLIIAAYVCEGVGLLIAVIGFVRLFVIGDGLRPFQEIPE